MRLRPLIPVLLPALERHAQLQLSDGDRVLVLAVSASTIDRLLADVRVVASGGLRRRAGFSSAVRRRVPIRTFADWNDPLPGFLEVDLVAHGGTSVKGSFIQTLVATDIATDGMCSSADSRRNVRRRGIASRAQFASLPAARRRFRQR